MIGYLWDNFPVSQDRNAENHVVAELFDASF